MSTCLTQTSNNLADFSISLAIFIAISDEPYGIVKMLTFLR